MNNVLILLLLLAFIILIDAQEVNFTITSVEPVEYVYPKDGYIQFSFTASYTAQFDEKIYFNLTIEDDYGFMQMAFCNINPENRPDYKDPNAKINEETESSLLGACNIKPFLYTRLILSNETLIDTSEEEKYNIKINNTLILRTKIKNEKYSVLNNKNLTFRQLNKFEQNSESITFIFLSLTMKELLIPYQIDIIVRLVRLLDDN